MRVLGGFWVVWVAACLPLALLPYGGARERQYDALQQLVANLGPVLGVILVTGLAWQMVISTRRTRPRRFTRAKLTNMTVDIKPRSRVVTDGLEATASRGMLRAVGMGDEDWVKPQVGVASSWNEITPCNLSLDRLAKAVKDGVHAAGGYPLEFGTISVSDGISMGHEGMHFSLVSREIIADSVETVMSAERLDGSVLLAGCDKSLPGMLMAAARLDLASVFLYAGSIMPGRVGDRDVTIIDAFEAVGACVRGLITRDAGDRDREGHLSGRGRLRRHVHRQHDGLAPPRRWACRCRARRPRRPWTGGATATPGAVGWPWSRCCVRASRPARS